MILALNGYKNLHGNNTPNATGNDLSISYRHPSQGRNHLWHDDDTTSDGFGGEDMQRVFYGASNYKLRMIEEDKHGNISIVNLKSTETNLLHQRSLVWDDQTGNKVKLPAFINIYHHYKIDSDSPSGISLINKTDFTDYKSFQNLCVHIQHYIIAINKAALNYMPNRKTDTWMTEEEWWLLNAKVRQVKPEFIDPPFTTLTPYPTLKAFIDNKGYTYG